MEKWKASVAQLVYGIANFYSTEPTTDIPKERVCVLNRPRTISNFELTMNNIEVSVSNKHNHLYPQPSLTSSTVSTMLLTLRNLRESFLSDP